MPHPGHDSSSRSARRRAPVERWGLLLALCLASSGWASAARVTLITQGDATRAQAFTTSLRELLSRLDVSLDGTDGPALAAVEADFTEPHVRLTVVDGTGRQVLVRRMPPAATTALQAEAAAHVVHAIVEELLAAPQEPEPPPDPEPAPPPLVQTLVVPAAAPRPPDDRRFGIDVGGSFGGKALGGPPATASGGLELTLSYRLGRFRPAVHLSGGYDAPFTISSDWLDLRVADVPLRLFVSLDALGGDAWRLDVGLGGGADLFVTNPSSAQLIPERLRPTVSPSPVLSAVVAGRVALASSVDLSLALAADVDLRPPRFVTDDRNEVFTPWRVRPSLVLGFSFNVLGPDPYRHRLGAGP